MKKIYLTIMIGVLVLGLVSAGIGLYADRNNNTIDIAKPQQDILEARNLDDIVISEMKCDGEKCGSCAKTEEGYGMGCISIAQKYCDTWSECLREGDEGYEPREICETECLSWTEYPNAELETNEATAYKSRWEGIADTIVSRENRNIETKFNEGGVNIGEEK